MVSATSFASPPPSPPPEPPSPPDEQPATAMTAAAMTAAVLVPVRPLITCELLTLERGCPTVRVCAVHGKACGSAAAPRFPHGRADLLLPPVKAAQSSVRTRKAPPRAAATPRPRPGGTGSVPGPWPTRPAPSPGPPPTAPAGRPPPSTR